MADEETAADGCDDEPADEHLADVPEGAGCTEIWEHLSEERDGESE